MNLPRYIREVRQANGEFQETISQATAVFQAAATDAAEKLDERLRTLQVEFFEDDDANVMTKPDVPPKRYA